MPLKTPRNKSRSHTPRNNNGNNSNNNNNNGKPKTKSRSQTPSHKHPSNLAPISILSPNQKLHQNQSPPPSTPNQTPKRNQKNATESTTRATAPLSPKTLQAFNDALEDVHTRFILNLPEEELASSDRLFFQIEQAWWFYEDFICDEMDESLDNTGNANNNVNNGSSATNTMSYADILNKEKSPSIEYPRYSNLKPFARKIFEISPILSPLLSQFDTLWKDFSKYRRKISTYGTILLNKSCDSILLCQDYNGKAWTLPAGKVNQNEKGIDAAIRETYEETGFDILCNSGTTKDMVDTRTWSEVKEEDSLNYVENDGSGKRRTCYICYGVPEDFDFAPVVRKEVADVQWHYIDNIPKKSFAVLPFMKGLKKWISRKNAKDKKKKDRDRDRSANASSTKKKRDVSKKKGNKRAGSKGRSCGNQSDHSNVMSEDNDLVQSGLVNVGDQNRWSEDDMFRANEELIGRKIEYDGNPQQFATKGFDGIDPHAFRIVGGGFMNSGGKDIAKAPEKSMLQPLFRPGDSDGKGNGDVYLNEDSAGENGDDNGLCFGTSGSEDGELKPFFSDDGATPWGEKVTETKGKSQSKGTSKTNSDSDSSDKKESTTGSGKKNTKKKSSSKSKSSIRSSSANSGRSEGSASDTIISESSIPSASEFEDSLFQNGTSTRNDNDSDNGSDKNNDNKKTTESKKNAGLAILTMLRGGEKKQTNIKGMIPASILSPPRNNKADTDVNFDTDTPDDVFMTDKEITAKSQKQKKELMKHDETKVEKVKNVEKTQKTISIMGHKKEATKPKSEVENQHMTYLQNWVESLPKSQPTKHLGDFRFDADAIMVAAMKAK